MKKNTDRQKPIIISLKKLQELNNLSAQDIHDMVEQQFPRDCPSISTIKSVFAEGSEEKHFNYDTSLKPILITLLGVNDKESYDPDNGEDYFEKQEAMKAVLDEKNRKIEELEDQINLLTKQNETLLQEKKYLKWHISDIRASRDKLFRSQMHLYALLEQLCHCNGIEATDFKDIQVDDMP